MNTYREIISQVRGIYRLNTEDAFVTDPFLYSLFKKYADVLMRRKETENKLKLNNDLYRWIDVVPLVEVDKIEADCIGIKTDCTYRRTKYKLPEIVTFDNGPLIGEVYSLDTSEKVDKTTLAKFREIANSSTFRYNKFKYFWFKEGHLYFPNVTWSAVTLNAIFTGSVTQYCKEVLDDECNNCSGCEDPTVQCTPMQDNESPYPDDIIADVIGMIQRDLTVRAQMPADNQDNSQNPLR